ncbi:MAG TPA: hypothetical protein PLK31_18305 [Chloroflexota bacterium]|nr:hypothetical protein [Chloroflexota bacterium]
MDKSAWHYKAPYVFFFRLTQKQPVISDAIGYVYAAERLAEGNGLTYEDSNNQYGPGYFSLFAFQIRRPPDQRLYLGFPPGFALLLAAFLTVTGQATAVHYVVPLLAVFGLCAAFFLGKLLLDHGWGGWWTAVLVVTAVTYWEFATAAWSEVPSMLFITSGFVLYLWTYQQKPSSKRFVFSVLAALLFVFSLFIRYSNITFLIVPGIFELLTAPKRLWQERDRWLFFILIGLGILAIPLFNHYYYGGATLTSYSPAHGWYPFPPFSFSYALGPSFVGGHSLIEMGKTLWENYPLIVILMPIGWLLMRPRYGVLVALAVGGGLFPYAIYAFAPADLNSRFLIPTFPFLAVSMAAVIINIGQRIPNTAARYAAGAVLLCLLLFPLPTQVAALQVRNQGDQNNVSRIQQLVAFAPKNAVFLSYPMNDLLVYYGHKSVLNYRRIPPSDPVAAQYQFEWFEPCLVITVEKLLEADIPVYYIKETGKSGWDPFEILRTHFHLEERQQDPIIYQIEQAVPLDPALSCPP